VHDFRKCHIHVLHVIEPTEEGAVQEDKDKKDCKPDPTKKPVEIGSPPSIATDTRSNQMVTRFPPTPDEIVCVEEDCKPDPTEKPVKIGSPPSIATDSRSNQRVTGFPPTPDEFVYVEEDCMKYVHGSGPLDRAFATLKQSTSLPFRTLPVHLSNTLTMLASFMTSRSSLISG
jgi:hypothetical protein